MAPKKDKKSESLLKYLRNQSDYLNARQALSNYAQTFKGIELQFNNTPASSKNFSEVSRAYKDAQTRIDALQKAIIETFPIGDAAMKGSSSGNVGLFVVLALGAGLAGAAYYFSTQNKQG